VKIRRVVFGLFLLLMVAGAVAASPQGDQQLPVPAGTKVSLQLLSSISTATSRKGDKFSCKVLTPAEYAGAIVEGHIRELKRSGKADKDSKIDLAFDRITLPDARAEDFSGTVVEVFDVANVGDQGRADNEGTVRSKSTTVKTSIKRAATGALVGALIGGVVAGGHGAALGAAIGAGVGATTTLASKGPDLEFKDGTQFTVECNGPKRNRKSETAVVAASLNSPEFPASEYRAYTNNKQFTLNTPANWRDSAGADGMVSFAPAGGYLNYQGRPNMTHGAMVGALAAGAVDLPKAFDQLVGVLIQGNPHLQRRGDINSSTIGGRDSLVATLSGVSPATQRQELVLVHAAVLTNGGLFVLITVAPEEEYGRYQEAFDHVLHSVSFPN
jgi:hypothetical protein